MDVQLPDGTIARFPDDMPETQIRTQLLKLAPPQPQQSDTVARTAALKAGDKSAAKASTWKGSILPVSDDGNGSWQFDSDAGIVGAIKHLPQMLMGAATLPGDVYSGRVDPQSDEGQQRAFDLATLAVPGSAVTRSGGESLINAPRAMEKVKPPVPTTADLKDVAGQGFDWARQSGTVYSPEAVAEMARAAKMKLEGEGYIPEVSPKTHAVLDRLATPGEGALGADITGLHAARKSFGQAGKDFANPSDQAASRAATDALDSFIVQPPAGAAIAGPAETSGAVWRDAMGNYAASKRSGYLEETSDAAQRRAAASNSGQNVDNSLRGRTASILESAKRSAPFNGAEEQALENVARGDPLRNATRYVGNLLGGGGGLGQVVTGGSGLGAAAAFGAGQPGIAAAALAPPIIGAIAKRAGNAMTERQLGSVAEMTRKRSPYYEELLADAPSAPVSLAQQAAAIRALLAASGQGQ